MIEKDLELISVYGVRYGSSFFFSVWIVIVSILFIEVILPSSTARQCIFLVDLGSTDRVAVCLGSLSISLAYLSLLVLLSYLVPMS